MTTMSKKKEKYLEEHIIQSALRGFPMTICDIRRDAAQTEKILRKYKFYTHCKKKGNMKTVGWAESYVKRHPRLCPREWKCDSKSTSDSSRENIKSWHSYIFDYLKSMKLEHLLNDPSIIATCDEAEIPLNYKKGTVLRSFKSMKTRHSLKESNRDYVTVLLTGLADGTLLKPLIVCKRTPKTTETLDPNDCVITKSGYVGHDTFLNFLLKSFVPQMKELNRAPPYLLFIDSHRTHMSLEISRACAKNGVIPIALYPNDIQIFQPFCLVLYKPFKTKWFSFLQECQESHLTVNQSNFPKMFKQFLARNDFSEPIRDAFKQSLIYPYCWGYINMHNLLTLRFSEILRNRFFVGPDSSTFYDAFLTTKPSCNSNRDNDNESEADDSDNEPSNETDVISYENHCDEKSESSNEPVPNHLMEEPNNQHDILKSEIWIDDEMNNQYEVTDYPTPMITDVTKHPDFEKAANHHAFSKIQTIIGPQFCHLLMNNQFQEFSLSDFALKKIFFTFKPQEVQATVAPQPVFGHVNGISSVSVTNGLESVVSSTSNQSGMR